LKLAATLILRQRKGSRRSSARSIKGTRPSRNTSLQLDVTSIFRGSMVFHRSTRERETDGVCLSCGHERTCLRHRFVRERESNIHSSYTCDQGELHFLALPDTHTCVNTSCCYVYSASYVHRRVRLLLFHEY
jgi:hypothetical protein